MKKDQALFIVLVVHFFTIIHCATLGAACQGSPDEYAQLYVATKIGDVETINTLINNGLCIDQANSSDGQTALLYSIEYGHENIVKLLINTGADLHSKNDDGDTCLHYASAKGFESIAKLLIDKGANLNRKDKKNGFTPLHWTAYFGFENIAKLLIDNGAELDYKDNMDRTALIWATEKNHRRVVEMLIERGAKLDYKDQSGNTALHVAILNENDNVAELLIERGAALDYRNNKGWTVLHSAVNKKNESMVKMMIEKGAALDIKSFSNTGDWGSYTALHLAAESGNEKITEMLVENGAKMDVKTYYKDFTPIQLAARNEHDNIVQMLNEKMADPNRIRNKTPSPLSKPTISNECHGSSDQYARFYNAAKNGQFETVNSFVRNGLCIDRPNFNGETALHYASFNGHANIVKLLIDFGANLNFKDKVNGTTPIYSAVRSGHENITKMLIENGAEMEFRNKLNGFTLLHLAAQEGHEHITKMLIENSTDLDRKDIVNRTTTLHLASQSGHDSIVKLLIDKGADLDCKDVRGITPFSWAVWKGHENITKMLNEKGADLNSRDISGRNSLHFAAERGNEKILILLLQNGSDVNAQNRFGETPLHFAVLHGNKKAVQILLENGANPNVRNKQGQLPKDLAGGHTKISNLLSTFPKRIVENECRRYSSKDLTDYIIGGNAAVMQEFPWMAALGYADLRSNQIVFKCGATVISERFILTAAHCCKKNEPPPIIVRMGTENLTDPNAENFYVQEIIRYSSESTQSNDIALIQLTKEIVFSSNIRPACLHTDPQDLNPNIPLTIIGRGTTNAERRSLSDELRKTDVVTIPLSNCNNIYLNYNRDAKHVHLQNGISNDQYCAHDPTKRRDSCWGDSGGPLQFFPHSPEIAHVVGVISFGVGCDTNYPTIHARVANYLDWIQPHVWPQPSEYDEDEDEED